MRKFYTKIVIPANGRPYLLKMLIACNILKIFPKVASMYKSLLISFFISLASQATEKPNVLFILTDQHFADAVSHVMGNEHISTPNIDKLAKNGVRFTKAYATNALCIPARASIFTGYYPFETGIQSNNSKIKIKESMISMGIHFKNAGYETGYLGKWHINMDKNDSKSHGFDMMGVLRNTGADKDIPAPAKAFINKSDKPFMLVTSFTSAHDICQLCRGDKLPSGPIGDLPPPEECPPGPKNMGPTQDETDTIKTLRESYSKTKMTPIANFTFNKWRQMRWGYYRLIERTDLYIGEVLTALEESGKLENTFIVFTADHGDCTGAHGFAQKTLFYDEASRIPFVVSYKGKIEPAVSDKLVNVGVDTLPTLLDYAGLPIPKDFKGLSARKAIETPNLWRDFLVTSNHFVQGSDKSFKPRGRMVRTDRFKYSIYDLGNHRESLIDMEKDPLEMTNLARNPEYNSTLKLHQNNLKEFAEKNGDSEALEILKGK